MSDATDIELACDQLLQKLAAGEFVVIDDALQNEMLTIATDEAKQRYCQCTGDEILHAFQTRTSEFVIGAKRKRITKRLKPLLTRDEPTELWKPFVACLPDVIAWQDWHNQWKTIGCGCTELLEQIRAGHNLLIPEPLLTVMVQFADEEAGHRRSPWTGQEVVDLFRSELATLAKGKPRLRKGLKQKCWEREEPIWRVFVVLLPDITLRLRWQISGYDELMPEDFWEIVHDPEFRQLANEVIHEVKLQLHRDYSTSQVFGLVTEEISDSLQATPRDGITYPKGTATSEPWFTNSANPIWMLVVVQIVRVVERMRQHDKRRPRTEEFPPDAITAADANKIRDSVQQELWNLYSRLHEPHKSIFHDLYLPSHQLSFSPVKWLNTDSHSLVYVDPVTAPEKFAWNAETISKRFGFPPLHAKRLKSEVDEEVREALHGFADDDREFIRQ